MREIISITSQRASQTLTEFPEGTKPSTILFRSGIAPRSNQRNRCQTLDFILFRFIQLHFIE